MRKVIFASIVYLLCINAIAQTFEQGPLLSVSSSESIDIDVSKSLNRSWSTVDAFTSALDADQFASYENLATYLVANFENETDKARSIYTWIATNITYDYQSSIDQLSKEQQNAQAVWTKRKAVCEGFANLFDAMCKSTGMESRIVKGFVREFTELDPRFPNHAWNSVMIGGKWRLLDVTWASVNNEGSEIGNPELHKQFAMHKLDQFFMVEPTKMVKTHLPEDPYWQLHDHYVNMEAFLEGPEQIDLILANPYATNVDFENLIAQYESLDSLDRSIAYLKRMECSEWNRIREYGLGIAYYYKAQQILKDAGRSGDQEQFAEAKKYYQLSLEQLAILKEEDYGYQFSRDLATSVELRIESLP